MCNVFALPNVIMCVMCLPLPNGMMCVCDVFALPNVIMYECDVFAFT